MNYELAKQLKDAGYPNSGNWRLYRMDFNDSEPTLSELIKACPLKQKAGIGGDIVYFTLIFNVNVWEAKYSDHHGCYGDCFGDGQTPEEAVAKLWLALNKK